MYMCILVGCKDYLTPLDIILFFSQLKCVTCEKFQPFFQEILAVTTYIYTVFLPSSFNTQNILSYLHLPLSFGSRNCKMVINYLKLSTFDNK